MQMSIAGHMPIIWSPTRQTHCLPSHAITCDMVSGQVIVSEHAVPMLSPATSVVQSPVEQESSSATAASRQGPKLSLTIASSSAAQSRPARHARKATVASAQAPIAPPSSPVHSATQRSAVGPRSPIMHSETPLAHRSRHAPGISPPPPVDEPDVAVMVVASLVAVGPTLVIAVVPPIVCPSLIEPELSVGFVVPLVVEELDVDAPLELPSVPLPVAVGSFLSSPQAAARVKVKSQVLRMGSILPRPHTTPDRRTQAVARPRPSVDNLAPRGRRPKLRATGMTKPAPATASDTDGPDEADRAMEQLVRFTAVLRRRWPVVAVVTLLALAGAAVAITTLRPRWRASATVVLHLSGPQILDKVKGVTGDSEARLFAYKDYYQTQREIIGSRKVAERALASLGLAQDPIFLGVDQISGESERLARAAEVDPIERLRGMLVVEEVRGSWVLRISADYPDADIAADIANAVADAYLAHVDASRTRTGDAAKQNVENERAKALVALKAAEAALSDFKQNHGISSISLADRQNVITEAIIKTTANLKDAESESFAAAAAFEEARRLHKEGSIASANLLPQHERRVFEDMRAEQLEAEREVEQLGVKYGEKMPELQQARRRLRLIEGRLEREENALLEALEARANAASRTERRLRASLEGEKKKALELTLLEREYRELEREAENAADTYDLVSKRDKEIDILGRVEAEDIEFLDRATRPRAPVFPPKALLLAIALVSGLTLGALLALVVDVRDHRIRGLIDLERALAGLGLPVLGQLPLLPADARIGVSNLRAQRRQRDLHTHIYPQSLMAERVRGVRTSLGFAAGEGRLKTLIVTSPSSSEGKSSTAINLAMSFVQARKRVVLVDADMRRPRLHQVFDAPLGREALGLARVLAGTCALDEALITGGDVPEGMAVLLCGEIPVNPAEMLESPQARKLLAELGERFDLVVLDTPPVLPVTDPLILARLADGVVIVARCQSTTRSELQRAISTLRRSEGNLLGVILNEVDARREADGYGVGYYAYHPQQSPGPT